MSTKRVGIIYYSCGLEFDKDLDLDFEKDFKHGSTRTKIHPGDKESVTDNCYHFMHRTKEQKEHEEAERDRDSQRHWEEERRIIEHNIRVSRENREKFVKKIWKEKDLTKAEQLLADYGEGQRMAGRMRLGERW